MFSSYLTVFAHCLHYSTLYSQCPVEYIYELSGKKQFINFKMACMYFN